MGPGVDELDENGVRRLLAYVAAAGIAGGQPVHEVEADTRSVGRYLGCPDVQVQGWPTGVVVSLGGGTPATFESVEGTIRLDQSATTARIRQQLLDGTIGPVEALEQLRDLRSIPPRYPRLGLHGGMVCVASGIALVLQPLWPSVLFSVLAGQVTAGFIWLSGKRKALAVLTPFLAAFVVALCAFWVARLGLIEGPLRSLLPPIAVLLPGALIVTGVAELAAGAMMAGASRLGFGTAQLAMFTAGVLGAAWLTKVPVDQLNNQIIPWRGLWVPFLGVLLLTAGMSLMESIPRYLVPWVALMLATTLTFQIIGQTVAGVTWGGGLLGATVASFGSSVIEMHRPRLPRLVLFLPSFWLLVPGSPGPGVPDPTGRGHPRGWRDGVGVHGNHWLDRAGSAHRHDGCAGCRTASSQPHTSARGTPSANLLTPPGPNTDPGLSRAGGGSGTACGRNERRSRW